MASEICPQCGAICQDTDTHCMDCGADLATTKRQVAEKSMAERGGVALSSEPQVAQGAGAGMAEAGETSEKVRLKEFDKHLAKTLAKERGAVIVTAIIALVIGAIVLVVGFGTLQRVGGLSAIKDLDFAYLRSEGIGAFGDLTFTGILTILTGVAGLLCAVGQTRRVMLANRAIAQVKRSERPEVVGISSLTWAGLLLLSAACAPVGLILGIIFKLGQDQETRSLGGMMIKVSAIAIGLVVVNIVWNLLAGVAASHAPAPAVSPETSSGG